MGIFMNNTTAEKLFSLIHVGTTYSYTWDGADAGKLLPAYDGIPIHILTANTSGSDYLPFTETQGSATAACSSLYVVNFADQNGDRGVFAASMGAPMQTVTQETNGHIVSLDWGITLADTHQYSVVRLKGIKAS